MNGDTMTSTFKPTTRMDDLSTNLDNRDILNPLKISGSGKMHQNTFWLDIGDRSVLVEDSNSYLYFVTG